MSFVCTIYIYIYIFAVAVFSVYSYCPTTLLCCLVINHRLPVVIRQHLFRTQFVLATGNGVKAFSVDKLVRKEIKIRKNTLNGNAGKKRKCF